MSSNLISRRSFDAGWLCLDFCNTVGTRKPILRGEQLQTWQDFMDWARGQDFLQPNETDGSLPDGDITEVVAVREAIDQLFRYYIETHAFAAEHLAILNELLREAYNHTHLRQMENGLVRVVDALPRIERPLWMLVLSAESLLLSGKMHRVRACDGCACLFLDTSKNGTRRWCNMESCGSQEKARNYYHRKKRAGA